MSAICDVYSNLKDSSHFAQKMELNCERFYAIIFYNFQQQCIDGLNSIFGDEAPSKTSVYRWCMVNSTAIVVHSKTNFVKVFQNQLLFRKPLMLCAN